MDKQTSLSENAVIFAVYLSGRDDGEINGDILCDARSRFFAAHKKIKDKVFFTTGIDSVRCRYQIDASKPMKWHKEINGKTAQLSVADSSGSYTVICSDLSGSINKKLFFSRINLWQKSEYYSNGTVAATVTACRNDSGLTLAVQYPGEPARILSPCSEKGEAKSDIVATAKTSDGEFYFCASSDESVDQKKGAQEEEIQRKGFFFDSSLIYGDFTTLNIKKGKTKAEPKTPDTDNFPPDTDSDTEETVDSNTEVDEENKTETEAEKSLADTARDKADLSISPDKLVDNSGKEKYCYFGSLGKNGQRNGSGVTATSKGSVIYAGGYADDLRSGYGAQFYKNGKISFVGKWEGDKKSGFGISFLNDGTISVGDFENDKKKGTAARFSSDGMLSSAVCYKNGEPHGAAITVNAENDSLVLQKCDNGKMKNPATVLDLSGNIIYNGEMLDGKYNGEGKLFDKNGDLKYSGEFKDGLQNGTGVLYLDDGSSVSGEFINGRLKGEAVHRLRDGALIYKGGFKDGEYDGKGTIFKKDGSYYSASFENGREKGAISVYSRDGELLYKGGLKNGEYNGKGTLYSNGEKVYEGGFAGGKKSGIGRLFSNNLCLYMGGFDSDEKSGFGISYKNNEAVYTGFWLNGKYNGQGVLHNSDDSCDYAGAFENGVMNGRINLIKNERLVKECLYENGKCTYMREYDNNGCVLYEGSAVNGVREGMGCSYTAYGEKQFEGIFKFGEPYKAMRVILKKFSELDFCEKLKDTAYHNYKKPPVFVSEQLIGKGIYSGSVEKSKPNGSGTMLYTDHRYTGSFKNGKPCGDGILYFGDGKELKGEFLDKPSENAKLIEFADSVYNFKDGDDE